jgi:hypothetical protein
MTAYPDSIQSEAVKADACYFVHAQKANAIKAKTTVSAFVWETDE